jgi:hypothetical protein
MHNLIEIKIHNKTTSLEQSNSESDEESEETDGRGFRSEARLAHWCACSNGGIVNDVRSARGEADTDYVELSITSIGSGQLAADIFRISKEKKRGEGEGLR